LRWSGRDSEVLVFLDGCTDSTQEKVEAFRSDSRLRVFSSKKNVGRVEARNRLIEKSLGRYIAILDSDDIDLPWRYLLGRKLMRKFDAVFSPAILFGPELPIWIPQVPRRITSTEMPLELLPRNPLVHSSAIYRREMFDRFGPYPESEVEEYVLWLRFASNGARMKRVAIPWTLYRLHAKQVSKSEGFFLRGENCAKVLQERIKLAGIVTGENITQSDLADVLEDALGKIRKHGTLANLEVSGYSIALRPLLRLIRRGA
jgi:glycosyltransferase involved in cell wall biosynthesis